MDHSFDTETEYCTRCGVAREVAVDLDSVCTDSQNVIAVSHIIASVRNAQVVRRVMQRYDDRYGVR